MTPPTLLLPGGKWSENCPTCGRGNWQGQSMRLAPVLVPTLAYLHTAFRDDHHHHRPAQSRGLSLETDCDVPKVQKLAVPCLECQHFFEFTARNFPNQWPATALSTFDEPRSAKKC